MANADAYSGSIADYANAWTTANAGASNSDVYSPSNPDTEQEIFDGGFAGKCSEEQSWQWDSSARGGAGAWTCSGNIPWTQAVMLPDLSNGQIGMVVMPYNTYDETATPPEHVPGVTHDRGPWRSYSNAYDIAGHTEGSSHLETFEAKCWPGGISDEPEGGTEGQDYIQGTVDLQQNMEEPFGISGTVSASTNQYSCSWNYTDADGNKVTNIAPDGVRELSSADSNLKQGFTQAHDGLKTQYLGNNDFVNQVQEWTP